ncbi:cytochrome ubiquinol oxidase subunit I [Tahibacter harae]|uniref:Cytochrome ubiquinol oxidase subunit I n=1 Tax=Tahibacter harae TaxID=2963937 RepID=A0ABT1QY75_9GAMM|nr:cytochrome ubiquinol oxidase subunit I [Tahibacter harae]MCQ4167242.1 cytochrome ubiquinol oxidase subunit I [Tahibacter harae]
MADAEFLSRIQFGFVISFHVLFPAFSIGLASWLAFIEAMWLRSRSDLWRDLYFFWLKIFAVVFGMGVVSGIVMSFQFGTNWARLSEQAGGILGPLLSYEVLTAFFLEATFLGVMLFGWRKVSDRTHFLATCMVALGTLVSSFWILSASSWMHTPAGHQFIDGSYQPVDWWAVIFNPSFPYRLTHMVLAAFITTAFVVGGSAAIYLLRGRWQDKAQVMLRCAVAFIAIVVPLQIVAGDLHGLNVREHQPAKLAAIEARWETETHVPLTLFAWPDEAAETNRYAVDVPYLGSLILTHSLDGEVKGLKDFAPGDRPPVKPVFFAFRVMVGLGFAMLGLAAWGLLLWWRGRLFTQRGFLRVFAAMLPAGFVAVLAGWYVTEIGRQPWVIYGLMRTRDAFSGVDLVSVAISLTSFVVVYAIVFGFGIWYLYRLFAAGPKQAPPRVEPEATPARPLSAAPPVGENA